MSAIDISMFEPLLAKRPEIRVATFEHDLQRYYLPHARRLMRLKGQEATTDGFIVGVSAIQGAGKTTHGEILETLLTSFGYSSVSRSLDDHYLTHRELCELRARDPRFVRRGVTHDIALAMEDLSSLRQMDASKPLLVSGFDKGVHRGDGDRLRYVNPVPGLVATARVVEERLTVNQGQRRTRALRLVSVTYRHDPVQLHGNMGSDIPLAEGFLPGELLAFLRDQDDREITITERDAGTISFKGASEIAVARRSLPNGWRLITEKPDFIFYDGWMLGVRPVVDDSVFDSGLIALDTEEARQFARDVNKRLPEYEPLWDMIAFLNVLHVVDYQTKQLEWREQAEEALRVKGQGMTPDEIREFVYYFWRSVHPDIYMRNLVRDPVHTQQVVILNDDHSVGEVLTPAEVAARYPSSAPARARRGLPAT